MKKNTKKPTLRLQIDRLFKKLRENKITLSFQNLNLITKKTYDENKIPYVCTIQPKRDFVLEDNRLIDEGFKIYYQFIDEKDYIKFKELLFSHLQENVFLKFKNYKLMNNDKPIYAGYIHCKNLIKKEEKE